MPTAIADKSKPTNGPVCSSAKPTENCCVNQNDSCYNDISCFKSTRTVWCQQEDENGVNNPKRARKSNQELEQPKEAYPS